MLALHFSMRCFAARSLIGQAGKLDEALDNLLAIEKQTRLVRDVFASSDAACKAMRRLLGGGLSRNF